MDYVLDACALLAYLKKETEGIKVVVTKDGEFQELEKNENLSVVWIKEPPQKS